MHMSDLYGHDLPLCLATVIIVSFHLFTVCLSMAIPCIFSFSSPSFFMHYKIISSKTVSQTELCTKSTSTGICMEGKVIKINWAYMQDRLLHESIIMVIRIKG